MSRSFLSVLPQRIEHLLRSLFDAYPRLQPLAQESLLSLITPVIRSLGAKPPNVAHAIETCPAGAEPLALCILNLLIDKGRLPAPLIASVKVLATRRELSPRFYVWIIGDCGKVRCLSWLVGAEADPRFATIGRNRSIPPSNRFVAQQHASGESDRPLGVPVRPRYPVAELQSQERAPDAGRAHDLASPLREGSGLEEHYRR